MEAPFFILSCDGGGVRGQATISFLLHLEKHMQTIDPDFCIYKKFNMFAGTSIGAFISMLYALKRKTSQEIHDMFNNDTYQTIMDKSVWDKAVGIVQMNPKYDGNGKTKVIDNYLGNIKFDDTGDKHLIVPTYNITKRTTKIFYSGTCDSDLLAKDVANATSAAPCYFPCVQIQYCNEKHESKTADWFIDGGMVANNPTMCAISHAYNLLRGTGRKIVVINVGTGYYNKSICGERAENYGGIEWLLHDIIGISMDQTLVNQQAGLLLQDHNYVNVNSELIDVSDDIDNCSDDNIKKLNALGELWWNKYKDEIIPLLV